MTQIATTTAQTLVPNNINLSDISAFYGIASSNIMSYGPDVVGGELYNVFSTIVGDENFEPTFGCDLPFRVFENATPIVEMQCRNDVYIAARDWVPRARVDDSQTSVYADVGNRVVGVQVAYDYAGASWTLGAALTKAFSGNL